MQQKLSPSQKLAKWTGEAESIFNHILGYVIATTALVAFADVLGNGRITGNLPWLFWIWVIAQGLCVEFQVFILVKRLPELFRVNRPMFGVNIFFIACLCLMSIVIGAVFVEHDNTGGSIDSAMSTLGINHIVFVYARAALAIFLIVLIAVDRALDQPVNPSEQAVNTPNTDEALARIEARFDQMEANHRQQLALVYEQFTRIKVSLEQPVEAQESQQLPPPQEEMPTMSLTAKQRVIEVLKVNPKATLSEIEDQAGVSRGYASEQRRIFIEQGSVHSEQAGVQSE